MELIVLSTYHLYAYSFDRYMQNFDRYKCSDRYSFHCERSYREKLLIFQQVTMYRTLRFAAMLSSDRDIYICYYHTAIICSQINRCAAVFLPSTLQRHFRVSRKKVRCGHDSICLRSDPDFYPFWLQLSQWPFLLCLPRFNPNLRVSIVNVSFHMIFTEPLGLLVICVCCVFEVMEGQHYCLRLDFRTRRRLHHLTSIF